MLSRTTPARLRGLPSWLLGQASLVARQLVAERLATLGEHRHHFSMLAALDEFGPMSQADLGRSCGLDRSDVTGAAGELEARGLLERGPDPRDRRRNVVTITDAGRRHLADLDRLVSGAQDELLAPLSATEREVLVGLLARVGDHHVATRDPGTWSPETSS